MCNRYTSPSEAEIERAWHVGRDNPDRWWDEVLFPRGRGPFIRHAVNDAGYSRKVVVGQWGLILPFAKAAKLPYSTNNARSEDVATKPSYRTAWAKGRRCIIPASDFDEPYWGTGKNIWWRFQRKDGLPWGLAGLWSTWIDRTTGEIHESYTMLTANADDHPVMRHMHKPDPKLAPDQQDKRSVISIEPCDVDQWLVGTAREAAALLRPPDPGVMAHGPVDQGFHATLPV